MKTPYQLIKAVYNKIYFYCCPDKIYLNNKFKEVFGRNINWKNPTTFNEKLQWLKIYDRNPLYTKLVDKYEVRKYIAEKIGGEYLIPCLGVWDKFEDIDFDKLPDQFVLKCTHDSHSVIICKDKAAFNYRTAKERLTEHLKRNFYYNAREWPYKHVKPRIIAEELMSENSTTTREKQCESIKDYKFFCFDGVVKFFKVDFNREENHRANYYDIDGNLLEFGEEICPPDFDKKIVMPVLLRKMINLAADLSKNMPFLRVDFYSISDDDLRFGELTFYPSAGFGKFVPDEYDILIGRMMNIEYTAGGICSVGEYLCIAVSANSPKLGINALVDYKFFCFNGIPKIMYISNDAGTDPRTDFFDMEYNYLPFQMKDPASDKIPPKPECFEKMEQLAKVLSKGIPHVRIDFYYVSGRIFVGELTFYHSSGFSPVYPTEWDEKIGEMIRLPNQEELKCNKIERKAHL